MWIFIYTFPYIHAYFNYGFLCDCISVMRDGDEHPTSFVEASQKKAKLKELSNNISDRSEA